MEVPSRTVEVLVAEQHEARASALSAEHRVAREPGRLATDLYTPRHALTNLLFV